MKRLVAAFFLTALLAGCGEIDWFPSTNTVSTSTAPTITTTALPTATVNTPVSQTISATGGAAPLSFTVTGGTLPAGLSLSPAGVISGTPTTAGSSSFTVTVTDSSNPALSGTQNFSMQIV